MKRYLLLSLILLAAASAMSQSHVSDLVVTPASGGTIKWYNASTGGTQYTDPANTLLVNGTTYYASQTVNGVESATRLAVTAVVSTVIPATPGAITGAATPEEGSVSPYSITAVPNATSYIWSVPNGMTIISGQGTINVTINVGSTFEPGGNITVKATNSCGTSAAAFIEVHPILASPQ